MNAPGARRLVLGGFLLLSALPAHAQEAEEERADVRQRISTQRAELEALRQQKVEVLELLEVSEKSAAASTTRAKALEVEFQALRRRVAWAEAQETLSREEMERRLEALAPRLWAMYRLRRQNPLNVLLDAEGFAALIRKSRALKLVLETDLSLLREAKEARAFHLRTLDTAQALKSWMNERLKALRRETARAEAQRSEFADLLSYIKAEATQSSRVIRELERAEKQLSTLVEEMESISGTGFGALRGTLSLPANGLLEVGFGKVVNPRFNTVTVQKGVDIRAPLGTLVYSVAPGKVAHAGWLRGYGNLLIVDHGDGYHTLFAHLADITRKVGEAVNAGDVVGSVGDSGSLKGAYLYFEIRQRGLAVDPARWFANSGGRSQD